MPTRGPDPFEDPLNSARVNRSTPDASSSHAGRPAHLRQRSLTARGGQSDLVGGHSIGFNAGPGAYLMRQHDEDGGSSRATSLYGDHEGSSSSHIPFGASTTHLNSQSQYSLSQDVGVYGGSKKDLRAEPDDYLHEQGGTDLPREGRSRMIKETAAFRGGSSWWRGRVCNIVALGVIGAVLLGVFLAFPISTYWKGAPDTNSTDASMEGVLLANAPLISRRQGPIDPDTPTNARTKRDYEGREMKLVFSDEFNVDGRYFYEGEDPYWTAQDYHYWGTNNLEWTDPDNIFTANGTLNIVMSKETLADSHNMGYLGGMLNSWNKFCFTGGRIEVGLSLPGDTKTSGLWPAAWMMGNLGRPGFGGSLQGTWPYTYDSCDTGTLPNQTNPVTQQPVIPPGGGDKYHDNALSYLPGQKFSACTCPGEDHPGPFIDGRFIGRGASEIDIIEALVIPAEDRGEVSMSGQWAPFNLTYAFDNSTIENAEFYPNDFQTILNVYAGGMQQQVTSGLSHTNKSTYDSTTNFAMYGVEYTPSFWDGFGTGSINWIQENQRQWRINDNAMGPVPEIDIGPRPVTGEPMLILLNHFMSPNFGFVDLDNLDFPETLRVDYVRVYQLPDHIDISCSTELFPTAAYIARHSEVYYNPNITTWMQHRNGTEPWPKNRLVDTC